MASAKELKDLTVEDLERRLVELREGLFQDKLKLKTGSLESPSSRVTKRRDVARILTVLTQKRSAEKKPAKA
jgi:large subunit ribosomal protein L29